MRRAEDPVIANNRNDNSQLSIWQNEAKMLNHFNWVKLRFRLLVMGRTD
jgi:hypothetical protein